MTRDELISPAYVRDQRWLHAQPKGYGGKGDKWADTVRELAGVIGAGTVLDYGCGRGTLGRAVSREIFEFFEYDPAIKGKDRLPEPADLVVCTDVLEHIEPDKLDTVIAHLFSLSRLALFAVISTVPSAKTLPDGRGAHLTVQPAEWWAERMRCDGFVLVDVMQRPSKKSWKEWGPVFRRS